MCAIFDTDITPFKGCDGHEIKNDETFSHHFIDDCLLFHLLTLFFPSPVAFADRTFKLPTKVSVEVGRSRSAERGHSSDAAKFGHKQKDTNFSKSLQDRDKRFRFVIHGRRLNIEESDRRCCLG